MSRKILFDGTATQGIARTPYSGGSDYAIFVLESALRKELNLDLLLHEQWITNPRVLECIDKFNLNVIYITDEKEIYDLLNTGKYDTFFSALPKLKKPFNAKNVKVIHGLRSIELPWDKYRYKYESSFIYKLRDYIISYCPFIVEYLRKKHIQKDMRPLLSENSTIITVSEHTLYSIRLFYPDFDVSRLKVIPSPVDLEPYAKQKNQYGKYILIVNGNRYEKNAYRAIQALTYIFDGGQMLDTKVVITGGAKMPFKQEIRNKNQYVLLDYVSNEELEALYQNAFIFLYPSLNEGYGYPPLIAMANGVPVAASSASSIPGVCQEGAVYFNPLDIYDMANRILQLYYNAALRQKQIEQGYQVTRRIKEKQNEEVDHLLKLIFD